MSLSPFSFSVWINKVVVILENLEARYVLVAAQRKAKAAAEIRYLSRFPYRVGSAPVGTDVCGVESLQSQSRLTIDTGFVTWHPDVWAPFILETKNNTWKQPKLLSKADILQCNLFYDQISRECSSWTCPKRHVLNFILELSNIKGPAPLYTSSDVYKGGWDGAQQVQTLAFIPCLLPWDPRGRREPLPSTVLLPRRCPMSFFRLQCTHTHKQL